MSETRFFKAEVNKIVTNGPLTVKFATPIIAVDDEQKIEMLKRVELTNGSVQEVDEDGELLEAEEKVSKKKAKEVTAKKEAEEKVSESNPLPSPSPAKK